MIPKGSHCSLDRKLQRRYARVQNRKEESMRAKEIQELADESCVLDFADLWSVEDNNALRKTFADLRQTFEEDAGRLEFDGWGDLYYADPPVKDDVSWLHMCNGSKAHQRESFQNFKIKWHTGTYADTYDLYDSGEIIEAGDTGVMDAFLGGFLISNAQQTI